MRPTNRRAYRLRDLYRFEDLGRRLLSIGHPALESVTAQIRILENQMDDVEISFAEDLASEEPITFKELRR